MSEGYGEHAERLAGYGVGSGELRDYEPFSLEEAETVEANERKGQASICPNCGFDQDGQHPTHCGSCGWPLYGSSVAVNVAPSSAIPGDAEESYCGWLNERERNQRENERDAEEREWARQELLQEETDNT